MKKEHPIPVEPQYSFSDSLNDNGVVQWISQNGKQLLYIILGLIAFALLISRFFGSSSSSTADYLAAESAYTKFTQESDPKARDTAFEQLNALLKKHPELLPKYEGGLAQTLLLRGDLPSAVTFAQGIMHRTAADHLELFNHYSKTTLLIADNKWETALSQAQDLKAQLESLQKESSDAKIAADEQTLYLFNLIRIAMLHQALKQTHEEIKTWQAFKEVPVSKTAPFPVDSALYEQVVSQLGEGEANLLSYIDTRLKVQNLKVN